jgi:hypothetical protein
VHRDIKPGNLMLDRHGVIKVLDLGLARSLGDAADRITEEHAPGSILGTADYLPPEQAVGDPGGTVRGDVYSLGATLYCLLTGQAPFAEGSIAQKMIWHQTRPFPPLSASRPDTPADLDVALARMTAKEPGDRYPDMAAVAQALAPWAPERLPPPAAEDMPRFCPAVQRLFAEASSPSNQSTLTIPSPPTGAVGASTGVPTSPSASANLPSPPHRRRGPLRRLLLWGAVAVVAMLVASAYPVYRALSPPQADPPGASVAGRFDPLKGLSTERVLDASVAQGHIGMRRTVRLAVKDRARDSRTGTIFLYAVRPKKGKPQKIFTVAIDPEAQARFRAAGVPDPYESFKASVIEVTGTITYIGGDVNRPGIEVKGPDDVETVK